MIELFLYCIQRCLVPLSDRNFAKLEGELDKDYFYFINVYILQKISFNKILVNQIKKKFVMSNWKSSAKSAFPVLRVIHILT